MTKINESLELLIANEQLAFQIKENEKRTAELLIANKELAFQNEEKEKRAAELRVANIELIYQNREKEKRAAELAIANKELAFQNEEKERRAEELKIANNELLAFTYISSHDLQEPLRKIQMFASIILEKEHQGLSDNAKYNFERMQLSAARMQRLIEDLLAFSRINTTDHVFEQTDLSIIVQEVISDLSEVIKEKNATIEIPELCPARIIAFQFRQLMYNLVSNALKFASPDRPPHIIIKSSIVKGDPLKHEKLSPEKNYCHISVSDNGIGFEHHFNELVFELFQKLHRSEDYKGTGIGLAIVKKIVVNWVRGRGLIFICRLRHSKKVSFRM
jgi:light-regulated signal transduction histidine kinase (bacteriophytochrome)